MATNGSFAQQEQYKAAVEQGGAVATEAIDASGATNDLSKDEVGWYFVEQYYTTLSKSPDRIHLFYNKRSQFVSGIEAEVANVSVGRQAIQDRIKQLDFHDTKVRVSNVDSQASSENIVIQVIGELSNKAAEPKKFVQTFVLAQQPTGYFVLNDIMRYIDEENDAETGAAADAAEEPSTEAPAVVESAKEEPVEAAETAKESSNVADTTAVEQEAQVSDDKPDVNGGENVEPIEAEKPSITVDKVDPEATARELAEEDAKEPEKPQDPTPTPVVEKASAPLTEPVVSEPTGPPKPMTWASRAAAAAGPRPVVPLPKTATPPAQAQNRAPAPAAAPAAPAAASQPSGATAQPPAPAAAAAAAAAPTEAAPKDASGWQTAGSDSKRQNRPQSISANPVEKEGTLGYVKYVTDKVQDSELRKALEAHGELAYFDINRQKNCAFVEYKNAEALLAALSANPHVVSGESIVVEQRRPKAAQFGGNFPGGRGGSQRGRGGFDGNRGGSQGNPRGGFSGQNRGRGGAARGRGNAQATTA